MVPLGIIASFHYQRMAEHEFKTTRNFTETKPPVGRVLFELGLHKYLDLLSEVTLTGGDVALMKFVIERY